MRPISIILAALTSLALSWPAPAQEAAAPAPPLAEDVARDAKTVPADDGDKTVAATRVAAWQQLREMREIVQLAQHDLAMLRGDWNALKLAQAVPGQQPSAMIMPSAPPAELPPARQPATPSAQAALAPAKGLPSQAELAPSPTAVQATSTTVTGPVRVRQPGLISLAAARVGDGFVGFGGRLQRGRQVKYVQWGPASTTSTSAVGTVTHTATQTTSALPVQAELAPTPSPQSSTTTSTFSAAPSRGIGLFRR